MQAGPPPASIGEEIVAVSRMRACWFYAEERFEKFIRQICLQWTAGDRAEANGLYRLMMKGKAEQIPAELAFAVKPALDMMFALHKGREQVDTALKLAAAADPVAKCERFVSVIPPGYISRSEACQRLGVPEIHLMRGTAFYIAKARSITIAMLKRGKSRRFYSLEDIEAARKIKDEEDTDRLAKRIERASRSGGARMPLGAISVDEVMRRTGLGHNAVRRAAYRPVDYVPKMYRHGGRIFTYEPDLADFLARQRRFEDLKAKGWLDSRAARARSGFHYLAKFSQVCRALGIKPVLFGHHALYSPQDMATLRWTYEAHVAAKAAARLKARAERQASKPQRSPKPKIERPPPLPGIPSGMVPMREALLQIGMTRKRFDKIMAGCSGTPIPPSHKAPNGHRYCKPEELAAFLDDRQANRALIVRRKPGHEENIRSRLAAPGSSTIATVSDLSADRMRQSS